MLIRVWKKLIPVLMDDLEGFRTSVGEVTTDVLEPPSGLELEVKPEDVTDLLHLMIKLELRTCFLRMSKESTFLR